MSNLNNSKNVINHIKKRKNDLIKLFGSKCCICGFDTFQEALEFHHVDPDTKEFGLGSSNDATKSLEKQITEARKCILVCANCHRGIHYNQITIPQNWQSLFQEDVAKQLLDQLEITKHGQKHFCQRCGKEIPTRDAIYCPDCNYIMARTVERPSREELKILIREKPFTQIGEMYGVSDNAIRKWCDAEGLPRKKTDINKMTDEEWEKI